MPKAKSMRDYDDHYINQVQDTLNHRLRNSLNYLSAGETLEFFSPFQLKLR